MMNIPLGDFNRGAVGQSSFEWVGQRWALNICYEDLFGDELAKRFVDEKTAPTVMVNVSNIGWFGNTVAIDQHMHSYADKLFDSQWTQWLDPTLFEGFKRYADSTVAAHLFGYSEEFSSRLLSMAVVDQGIRKLIGVLEDSGTVQDSTLSLCWRQLDPIDSVNAADYLKLYSRHGFPDIDVVGEDANKAGWLILQHAPLAIQEQFLPIFRNSCERGQTPWQYYAYLTDRVMNRQGLPATKYGCSFIREPDGVYYQRVEDKACVNGYREAVGMPPLDGCRQFQNGEPCTP
jgi:hypothetical protein